MVCPAGKNSPNSSLPLKDASQGDTVKLMDIRGGARLQHRLAEMGLTPGTEFKVVSNSRSGPCVVLVKGTRMMIGRGMIDRVFVVRV
ncbi:MAG: ferrous iron transport protein A [Phycisphaerae bacterium]|nr:ferrous iron transport protein A [Phycisphaerae bacterium]